MYLNLIFLLRDNHEASDVNTVHGFKRECVSRSSPRLWTIFNDVFDELPIGCKIFASHGGTSPDITNLPFFDSAQPLTDLMWSDADPFGVRWRPNPRGRSFCYGPE